MTPYPGHHREYVKAELQSALAACELRVLECQVIDEDLRPALRHMRRERNGSFFPRLWRHRKDVGPAALGQIWSLLGLPFGRVLWAIAEKER